MLLTDL